jgi:tRNA(Ile)-lysidine synthase
MHCQSAEDLEQKFFAKLNSIIQIQVLDCQRTGIAVAYSGGLDSTVLLALTSRYAKQNQTPVFAYHINHGLSPNALHWQQHCAQVCEQLDVRYRCELISVQNEGQGIEAIARQKRYQALGRMCELDQVALLLVAHHMDDQAETMLMQLFRGTGLRGLSGMDEYNFAPTLLGTKRTLLGRPLLCHSKSEMQNYAKVHQLLNVEDESNLATYYTRNALRHRLMPLIEELFPGFPTRLMRTSGHVRAAQNTLDELAANDLMNCGKDNVLSLTQLNQLSADRVTHLFRYWLTLNLVQLPSTSKIAEIQTQLWNARDDARVQIRHGNFSICRYQNKIYLIDHRDVCEHFCELSFSWNGEASRYFPELKGTLKFLPSAVGIAATRLSKIEMTIRQRQGGERLRLGHNRPSRDLKSHFQTAKIPFWQREKLPCIYVLDRLFFVGLLGMDAAFIEPKLDSADDEVRIELIWIPD